jgi:hypothetical protein
MLQLDSQSKIIFFHKPINMHKGHDALIHIICTELGLKLVPNLFVLFSNRRKNRIKIIFLNGEHLLLLSVRFPHALRFKYEENIIFDQNSFHNFINSNASRRYFGRYKNL